MPPGDAIPPRPRTAPIDPPPRAEIASVGGGREQEQSIRARKQLLFEEEELTPRHDAASDHGPRKSFSEYLRATPAAPLSGSTRAMLWGAGLIVVLLFIASLVKRGSPPPNQGRGGAPAAAAQP